MRMIFTAALIGALVVPGELAWRAEAHASQQDKSSNSHPSPRPPSNWWKTPTYMQELKLTTEQSNQIEQIVQTSVARLRADKEDLDHVQADFRQLMEQPSAKQSDLLRAAERLEMARFLISKE